MKTIVPGQVVDINLPARLRLSSARIPDGLRITALVLTFREDGTHRDDVGNAADIDPATSKTELPLEVPAQGDRQVLMLIGTRNGAEVPFGQLPAITVTVEDGTDLYSWTPSPGPEKATIVLQTYIRNGATRLRVIDQGYVDGWSAFRQKTGCQLDLGDILASTLADLQAPAAPLPISGPAPVSEAALADRMTEIRRLDGLIRDMESQAAAMRREYGGMKSTYDQLVSRVRLLNGAEEILEMAEIGMYRPHFDFGDSEQYKTAIESVRATQKQMVTARQAVVCSEKWSVGGDVKAGEKMVERQVKLTLRAFNGEADAAVSNARWNNVVAMEKRIRTSADTINKANESIKVVIMPAYVDLKIRELRLAYEFRDKQKQERDLAAEQRREQREQDRLDREVEAAEREERKFQTMLDRARAEAEKGNQTQAMKDRIARLEADLDEARRERERTRALAEQTKCGYVYVISNVGSFGEGIVKIGMTRRSDPEDRVRELSSASVPFSFDIHAMAYSNVASELEGKLHRRFHDRRVNVANNRKEFFQCTVDEVERAVREIMPDAPFTRDREAREWRETVAMRNQRLGQSTSFPTTL